MPAKTPAQAAIDKFVAAVDTERLRSTLTELLDEEPFSVLSEWAESLTTVAEAVDTARSALEEWAEAEDRETKADAKVEALSALEDLVSAWNDSPLDLARLEAWTPDEDDES